MSSPANMKDKIKQASSKLPPNVRAILSLPPKWLVKYDDFVAKNASQVSQMESALRSLTYIIPGRFRDAELATEGIHSGVQLLSLYHDLLLFRASGPMSLAGKSLHARYTRFWAAKSTLYRRVAVVLQVVQYTELLLEMWAKRRGETVRWRVVVLIEAVKAFCRLLLLRITRSRPLVTPALPERENIDEAEEAEEDDGKALAEMMGEEAIDTTPEHGAVNGDVVGDANGAALSKHDGTNGNGTANGHSLHPNGDGHLPQPETPAIDPKKEWSMPRTGLTLPTLPTRGDISTYLLTRVLTADDIKPATKLLYTLYGSSHTAEVLHILSPLIYAIALSRSSGKRNGWTPWLIGLSVQVASRKLAQRARTRNAPALEREEWTRRGRQMWWWMMRGAAYENVVKGVVGGVTRRVPGFVGTILEDYEYLWENYYFSTSDS